MGKRSWSLLELSDFCSNEEKLLDFLKEKNLIPQTKQCPKCGWGMKMHRKIWTCYKAVKTKKGKRICNTRISVRQWNLFVKQVVVEWLNYSSEKIGGIGMTVEIDEAEFGKRKYNRGRVLEGQWVFGGICGEAKKIFLIPVEDRTSSTLVRLIKEWVLPGSRIISDCLREYRTLEKEEFEHLTVNHSMTFVDKKSGAHNKHSNTIESMWRHVKEFLPSHPRSKKQYIYHMANYMFIHSIKKKHLDLFNAILEEISHIKFDEEKSIEFGSDEEFSDEEQS